MGRVHWWGIAAILAVAGLALAACDTSNDEERLAAQRLFRNYLVQPDDTAAADVRIELFVDTLPPDFPLPDGLTLLGSAFTDTDAMRELIVGWETDASADTIYDFYREALDRDPWSIETDFRIRLRDFITFRDADNPAFEGELRIAQEHEEAVVLLIARERLAASPEIPAPPPSGRSLP